MSKQCDLLIDYINDQLTEDEKQAFETHLASCSECQAELEEINQLTADLGFGADPIEPPSEMKERVLTAAFAQTQPNEKAAEAKKIHSINEAAAREKSVHPLNTAAPTKRKRKNWMLPVLAAALFFSLIGNVYTVSQLGDEAAPPPIDTAPPEENPFTVDSLVRSLNLQPSENVGYQATASIVNKENQQELVVQAQDLAQPAQTEVYQVWLISGEDVYRAGTFTPSEDGNGMSTFTIDASIPFDTIAITLEPDATSETPKGDIVLSEQL